MFSVAKLAARGRPLGRGHQRGPGRPPSRHRPHPCPHTPHPDMCCQVGMYVYLSISDNFSLYCLCISTYISFPSRHVLPCIDLCLFVYLSFYLYNYKVFSIFIQVEIWKLFLISISKFSSIELIDRLIDFVVVGVVGRSR